MADKVARLELANGEPLAMSTSGVRGENREQNNQPAGLKAAQVELVKLRAPGFQCIHGSPRRGGAAALEVGSILWQR